MEHSVGLILVASTRGVSRDALITGCSSIYKSLQCTAAIAETIGRDTQPWLNARQRLGDAVRNKPHLFDRTWAPKARYSMDWFYPVLSGALNAEKAQERIEKDWKKFVIKDQGVRCVSDRPWITVAETCELILALAAMGNLGLAETVFSWIRNKTNEDGTYWCGFTCPDMTIWPEDKST